MMKSPFMRPLFVISAWLCTIAALHAGLVQLMGYSPVETLLGTTLGMPMLYTALQYAFGIAGIFLLIYLLMDTMNPGSMIKE